MGDVCERGRDVEQEVEDDEVVPLLRLVLQLGALHPHARPHEALQSVRGSSFNDVRTEGEGGKIPCFYQEHLKFRRGVMG